jgi:hypothetical protein
MTQTRPERKPYCKVCHDAGKPESDYTSHYVRSQPDRKGNTFVLCPVLKATECKYCFQLGHTTKFCPVLAAKKKDEARREYAEKRQEEEKKEVSSRMEKPKSGFAVLADSSDSEDEKKPVAKVATKSVAKSVAKEVTIKEEFPALSSVLPTGAKPVTIGGWASVAAKSAEEFQNEKYEEQLRVNSLKRQMPPTIKVPHPTVRKSWADWSDSEDEEDEYEEAYQVAKVQVQKACELDWAEERDEDW